MTKNLKPQLNDNSQAASLAAATMPQVSITQLLEAGVHFGHRTMRRNPKMARYIYTDKNGINIINLGETRNCLERVLEIVKDVAKNNGRILFVATKRQATTVIAESAKRCNQYYVNRKWLGGMLTNWKTVSQSIAKLRKIEEQLADTETDFNKKEKLVMERKRQKLEAALGGIKNMGGKPDLLFIIDTNREVISVLEAQRLGIPIAAIVDTNSNPIGINYPIPGNDDSAKAIKLYCYLISEAILVGERERMIASGVDITKIHAANVKDSPKVTEPKDEVVIGEAAKPKPARRRVEFKASEEIAAPKHTAKRTETKTAKTDAKQDKSTADKPVAKKTSTKPAAKPKTKSE